MRTLQITRSLVSLGIKTKPWDKEKFVSKKNAVLIRQSLEKLGSVFIKFGQMLALRPDFIPEVFCDELYKLLDQVPPFDPKLAVDILKKELGDNSSKLLEFDPNPVASASFAQVHKARLENGEMLAVKIQRPNIESVINRDLAIMRLIARLFDFWFKPANKLAKIVDEFETWTKDELDYSLEAANIERFNTTARLVGDGIRGPRVYKDLSASKVLTMEFIDGYSLTRIISLLREDKKHQVKEIGFDGKDTTTKLIKNMLEMCHIHGFFHADPHPANIIFTAQRELIFIDFGIVGVLSRKERILILRYLRSMLTGNSEDAFNSLVSLCGESIPSNLTAVKQGYELISKRLTDTFTSETYLEQQKKSGPILVEALNLLQRNGFEVPVSVVRYFKAFETIEGLIFALYPELQVKNMVKEFRRVSIMNIIDSLPAVLKEKRMNDIVLKLISLIEDNLLLR